MRNSLLLIASVIFIQCAWDCFGQMTKPNSSSTRKRVPVATAVSQVTAATNAQDKALMDAEKNSRSLTAAETAASVSALKKAAQYLRSHPGETEAAEFLTLIREARFLFPVVPISQEIGKPTPIRIVVNDRKLGIDGFRFRTPSGIWQHPHYAVILISARKGVRLTFTPIPSAGMVTSVSMESHTISAESFETPIRAGGQELCLIGQTVNSVEDNTEFTAWIQVDKNERFDTLVAVSILHLSEPDTAWRVFDGRFRFRIGSEETRELGLGLYRKYSPQGILNGALHTGNREFIDYAISKGGDIKQWPALATVAGYASAAPDTASLHAIVLDLLNRGADPNHTTPYCASALYEFSGRADAKAIIKDLIKHKADVNLVAPGLGMTAIFNAIDYGCLENAKLLVEAGADLRIRDRRGRTPAKYAEERLAEEEAEVKPTSPDSVSRLENIRKTADYIKASAR